MGVNEIVGEVYASGGWLVMDRGKLGFPQHLDPELKKEIKEHKEEIIPLLKWDWDEAKKLWHDSHDYVYRAFKEICYLYNGDKIRPCRDWQIDLWVSGHDNPLKEKIIEAEKRKDMGACRAHTRAWVLAWLELKRDIETNQQSQEVA